MTTPLSEWDCFHCGERCGGRSPRGYAALTGPDMPTHATCSPDEGDTEEFIAYLVNDMGYSRNECPETCPHKAGEHAHLHSPGNPATSGTPARDFILWGDGTSTHSDPTAAREVTLRRAYPGAHPDANLVAVAQAEVGVWLNKFQREHGLTNIEMLQAVTSWQGSALKYMLRTERHPDDPDKGADEE